MSERSKKAPNDGLFSPQNLRADRKAVIIVSFSPLCLSNVEKDYWENLLYERRERREEKGEEGKEKEKRKEKESNSLKRDHLPAHT